MTTSHNARQLLKPVARLDSAALADLYVKYKENLSAGDLLRLWWEVDALRFDLAAADERTRLLRQERDELQRQLYAVRAALPRAGGPV